MRNRIVISKSIKKICFLLSFHFLLAGCLFFQPSTSDIKSSTVQSSQCAAGNARFIATQISIPPTQEAITFPDTKLKDTFILNLKTCLKDSFSPDVSMPRSSFFEVTYDSNLTNKEEKVLVVSDAEGCIQWSETYKYKYTLHSSWIGLERVIKQPKGPYKGAVKIKTAVNPWMSEKNRNGRPIILDMRCEYANHSIFKSTGSAYHKGPKKSDKLCESGNHYSSQSEKQNIYYEDGLRFLETADHEKPLLWAPKFYLQVRETLEEESETSEDSHKENNSKRLIESEIKKLLTKYRKSCEKKDSKDCYKRSFNFYFRIPLVEFRSMDSTNTFDTQLRGGVYNIESSLLISPKGKNKNTYKLSECKNNDVELNDKYLVFYCIFDIAVFHENSDFQIFHKISSVNPNNPKKANYLPVRDFQGKYSLTLNFESMQRLEFELDVNDVYNEVLKNPCENLNLNRNIKNIIQKKGNTFKKVTDKVDLEELQLEVSTTGFDFANISEEDTVERRVIFSGKVCLKDALESQKLGNTKFRIFLQKPRKESCDIIENNNSSEDKRLNEIIPGQIEEIFVSEERDKEGLKNKQFETNNDQCLTIPISIPHKVFNKQRYFDYRLHVLSEDLNLYGSMSLALNPWQRGFQAFQDTDNNVGVENIRFKADDIKPPELIINQFRSINLFPSYGLDKLLNIHLFHRFYLLFQPFIMRPDNVALGLNHRSRELLRDGHYLVRVLIVRNPIEKGAWEHIYNQANLNKTRSENTITEGIDLKNAEYITHTDSVASVKANFVNFYMPIYLSTKQMYYIASRNLMVIQIYPADPQFIHYKEDGTIDREETQWKPFVDHNLINKPYAGPINIQKWTNWNLLQPVSIDTDEVINSSEIGKKYKKFNFSEKVFKRKTKEELDKESCPKAPFNESQSDSQTQTDNDTDLIGVSFACEQALLPALSYLLKYIAIENQKDNLSSHNKMKNSMEEQGTLLDTIDQINKEELLDTDQIRTHCDPKGYYSPALEVYQREVESKYTPELLNNFSLENALQPIVLGTKQAEEFTKDLQKSYQSFSDLDGEEETKPKTDRKTKQVVYMQERSRSFLDNHPFFERHLNKMEPYLDKRPAQIWYYHVIPSFESNYIKGNNNNYKIRDLLDAYIIMLEKYSSNYDFVSLLFQFVQENKELFYDEESKIVLSESCTKEAIQACSDKEKLHLLVHSDLFENMAITDISREEKLRLLVEDSNLFDNLIFTNHISEDSFIKKQAFLFMMLFILPEEKLKSFLKTASNPYEDLKEEKSLSQYLEELQEKFPYLGLKEGRSSSQQSKLYLEELQDTLKRNQEEILKRFNVAHYPQSIQQKADKKLNLVSNDNHLDPWIYGRESNNDILTQEGLKDFINEGVKYKSIYDFKNLPFFKSLCSFWFEDFMKKYLDATTKLSAYTTYLRQFDYLQVLEHAYIRNHEKGEFLDGKFSEDMKQVTDGINKEGVMKEKEKECHEDYRECVTEDFCSSKDVKKVPSLFYEQSFCGTVQFEQCSSWVDKICSHEENENLDLCQPNDTLITNENCFEEVNDFCSLNPDKNLCSDFQNRCFKKYTNCLDGQESQLFQTDWDQVLYDKTEPLNTCMRKFEEFFKIENKMIVYDISHKDSDLKYRGGFLQNFGISSNNSIGSYMNWTAQRGTSVSVSVSVDPIKATQNKLFKIFGISGSVSQGQSNNESNSGRGAWDSRSGGAVFLAVGKAEIQVGIKEFQKCLVLKPRVQSFVASFQTGEARMYDTVWDEEANLLDKTAFSRAGLILCNPVEKRRHGDLEQIKESYYYISQASADDSNTQFLDLYNLANRPFTLVLRGDREFLKFFHLTRRSLQDGENPINENSEKSHFVNYTPVEENIRKLNLKIREITQMGFYPGIYDYGYNKNEEMEAAVLQKDDAKKTLLEYIPFNIFGIPRSNTGTPVPIQQ